MTSVEPSESVAPPINPWLRRLKKMRSNKAGVAGIVIICILIGVAASADILAPYSYKEQNLSEMNRAPSMAHFMGTDEFGRDVFSRIIHGSRISVYVGVVSVGLSVLIGVIIGSLAGYYGGWLDQSLSIVTDLTWSLPEILVALLLVAIVGAGLECVIIAIALTYWAQYARLIRGQILMLKTEVYVEATRSLGATDFTILFRHLFPNAIAPVLVAATIGIGQAIVLEATLGFLGMGAQPPLPSWGAMMSNGTAYLFISPWVIVFPGLAMMVTVLGFNLFGDALVDILDIREDTNR
ncbi:peptide ABC transporter substrate-binding protein [Desulfosarcina ovata subsp. sediminis]|uniref:Peptide ABC transporter substrate-binding protein n=1 Tax=Desulfosarcina ovata subsp. sediminis TaxID=885957 RepID=A0A5K7ZYI2_9BACT|nr:ABC transporter permease [Desulfosarcina ovata]BBO85329.1 peptide ABC transporter substrate-binding protein [Desulfosarcina ovata subsp. sediminis]